MGKTADDIYEAWDLSNVVTPVRSRLYALSPIGMGTAFVESLTSYIARLADAHSVFCGRLIEKEIAPLVPGYSPLKRQHELFRGDGSKSNLVNATGIRALYAVQALETLTLRTDLHHLTLLSLGEVFYGGRGLIRPTKAWCPACYEEQCVTRQVIYDPLLWAFQDISICMCHKRRLQTHCPYQDCGRLLEPLTWRAQPGYCSFCQRWLGVPVDTIDRSGELITEDEIIWQQWVSDTLGATLIAASTASQMPEKGQISKVFTHIIQLVPGGTLSALARILGLRDQQIGQWVRGEKVPQVDILLRLCYALGLSLQEVLFQDPITLRLQIRGKMLPPQAWRHRPGLPLNREYLRQELDKALANDEYPPFSLAEIARQLGYQAVVLYQCNSSACYALARRYKQYLQQQKEARMQGHREEIKQIALQLRQNGVTLTRGHVTPYLALPGILRDPDIRKFIEEVRWELENE